MLRIIKDFNGSDMAKGFRNFAAWPMPNSPELASYLASAHLNPVAVAPFAPDSPPADRAWLGSYAEAISRLSRDRFFSDPLPTPDGMVVLLWNETLPSYKPLFNDVRTKVLSDYRETEKRRLFIERIQTRSPDCKRRRMADSSPK